jgi:tetratricopeptide (TPR) repeat protein
MQLQAGKIDEAMALLQKIPLDSPLRSQMDALVGQIAWAEYLRDGAKLRDLEKSEAPAEEIAALQTQREALKQTAQTTLEGGVERMQPAKFGKAEALAVIFLAQIYVGSDRAQDAVALLENPDKGVLAKLAAGNTEIEPKIAAEAYKVALRAYVSSIAEGANANEAVEKAKQTMDALDGTVPDKRTLMSIYISIAQDLQKQLENAPPAQRDALSKAFAAFLEQVGGGAQQLDVLVWVAETFYGIASSSVGPDGVPTPAAKGYFEQARGAYERILSMGDNKGGDWLTADVRRTVLMKLAMIDRELGDYQGAIDGFEKVLEPNNSVLNVQTEAAETLMKWGQKDPQQYFSAIMGARKDAKTKRNVIWGWTRLGSVARQNANDKNGMMETFYLARLRMAEALRGYALAAKDPAQKKKYLEMAEDSILQVAKAIPTMGGPEWKRKFDDVMKTVQKDLGKPADGLSKVLPPPAPETASR